MNVPLRTAAAAALLLAVAGCSVTGTGAVRSGLPATGVQPGTRLYFPGPEGLRPVVRADSPREDLQQTLDTLLAGPDPAEQRAGLYTALPAGGRVEAVGSPGTVTLRLSWSTAALTTTAVQQLVCTAEDAPTAGPPPQVAVLSSDAPGPVRQQCDLHRTD
ncbi:GerMN domain-containing protein [Kitasatospora sp. NPDC089913]|uniref:GerMN domain-containing protein n=1 Tax=Streptomycetaceae TaxID=2062 RepID=UPI00087C86F0|nr:GerMN domain-containing protein [Streptomyces sp. TLI_053]SDS80533.1 Sporulation and spore germination [Streptomyces sp. TLI_053]